MQQVADWLKGLGMSEYAQRFADNGIDMSVICDLSDQDLKELSVSLGHRRKMLAAIAEMTGKGPVALERSAELKPKAHDAAERRQVTVMFSDLVGSAALSARMDAEDLHDIISSYQKCVAETVGRFGGFVAKYLGDGVLVYFGYPQAHEDDAERAVRAGLELVHAVTTLKSSAPLQIRVGIATGVVVVGHLFGSGEAQERDDIVGETPNLAALLQGIAEPDSVVIAEGTRKLLGNLFHLEDLGAQDLKGIAGPVRAWTALRPASVESRFEAFHASRLTELVGREEELGILLRRWSKAKSGGGQVVLLSGEAGIGKSRGTAALLERIASEPHTPLRYFCSPHYTDSPLYPIIGQMERAAGLAHNDTSQGKLDKLDALLAQTSTSKEDASLFVEMLSLSNDGRYPAYPPVDVDPQRRKERTLNALVDRITKPAAKNSVLMIVEDLHWADPTTLEFLNRLIPRLGELRILLIMTHRPEFRAPWTGQAHVSALFLNRLSRRYCRAMVKSVANAKPLPISVMDQVIAKTDGVPLFVEELTKTLLESGLLREERDSWVLTGSLQELAIPTTLQDSLLARLDRLPSVKEVAQLGAAIGREFPYNLLATVSSMPESALRSALDRLAAAEIIFARGSPPAASYVFKHALVQDAAYETLLKSKRQQLHGRIAKALEDKFPEVALSQPEIVAHHYTEAGRHETAVPWWGKAGDLAIKRSANTEAVRHFDRAIELLHSKPESRERDACELEMRIKLSGPLIATGGYVTSELADNYTNAWRLCEKLEEKKSVFPVMYGQWVIPYVRGDMAAALANAERFLRQAEQQHDTGLLMMGHRIYGSSLVWRGDTRQGSEHLRQALSLYSADEHDKLAYIFSQHPRTAALAHLCLALQHLGFIDQAMDAGWQAISDAKRIGHFNSIAYSLCFVSLLIMLRRDVPTLKTTAGELLRLAKRYGASYWALWAKPMLGWIAAQEGNIETGIRQMHESAEALQRQKANLWVPQTLLLEAEILGNATQYQDAYILLDAAQSLIEPLDQRFYEAELHRVRGAVLIAEKPDSPDGMASLDRAIDVARRQSSRFLELRACVSKARVWRDRGFRDEGRELLGPVYRSFNEGLDTVDLTEARALLEALA